jgi:hypothetical protein
MCPCCDTALVVSAVTSSQQGPSPLARLVDEAKRTADGPPLPHPDEPDDDEAPLYAARRKIYPQHVTGTYRRVKWAVLFVTLGIYYLLPFVRWDRGPNAPDQAVLIDLPARRFISSSSRFGRRKSTTSPGCSLSRPWSCS